MKIHLEKIGPDGFHFVEPIEEVWLNECLGGDSAFAAAGPGSLDVMLYRSKHEVVHVRGSVRVTLNTSCVRCLFGIELALNQPIDVVLFPAGKEPEAGEDGELSSDDLGVGSYEGGEIDLSALVRDEIYLEMPMNPNCGIEDPRECEHFMRNLGDHQKDLHYGDAPVAKPTDSRWAALSKVKLS